MNTNQKTRHSVLIKAQDPDIDQYIPYNQYRNATNRNSIQYAFDGQGKECIKYSTKNSKIRYCRWRRSQDQVYMNFLKQNQTIFSSENFRRVNKVFLRLSQAMDFTKSPKQCKSHHQKMQNITKNGTIEEIIDYLESKYLSTSENALYAKGTEKDKLGVRTANYQGYKQDSMIGITGRFIKITIFTDCISTW